MANTTIKALIGFSDGTISLGVGDIATVADTKATDYINGGLAVEFTEPIIPTGSIEITANDTYDVTTKASAIVNVPGPTGSETVDANGTYDITNKASVVVNVGTATVSYNVNGGTGSVDAVTAIKGNEISLNDGSGITAPDSKTFSGWATTNDASEPDVTSPYKVMADVILYAVYEAAE